MKKYSEEVFRKAEAVLSMRRTEAEEELARRKDYISKNYPEAAKLKRELETTSLKIFSILREDEDIEGKIKALQAENKKQQEELAVLLEAFTGDPNYLKERYICPICSDTGFNGGFRCKCFDELLRKFASQELNEISGIELHSFEEFMLDLYPVSDDNSRNPRAKMKNALDYCRAYAEGFSDKENRSLLLIGKTGLGKTFLSSCIAKTVSENGYSVVFGPISTYLRRIENEHFGRADTDTLSLLSSCDLLILDDLGSEFKTSFTESTVYEILNSRINAGKPTVVSTNLSPAELNSFYNERIVSRLTGCFAPIGLIGNDLRQALTKI
ncbi:MAG: ATP-binding protein [Ruminococcus sp.]|nr:ATP-binding protein [Ruminococcus sp.]